MGDARQSLSWLTVGMLAAVVAGAAALGVAQAPVTGTLGDAVTNTLDAPNYNEVASEKTPQGSETAYLTYQAPDRLGGYVESGGRRTYIYFLGTVEYQSTTVSSKDSVKHLTFYRETIPGGSAADPAHTYLKLYSEGKNKKQSGNTTTMDLDEEGQTVALTYTVSGQYVAEFNGSEQGANIHLVIAQVGSAPPVKLPAGAKVVGVPNG